MQSPMNPSFLAYLAFLNISTRLFHSSNNGKYHQRFQVTRQFPRLRKLTISTRSQLPKIRCNSKINYVKNN